MFSNDCKKYHEANYETSCCIKHLVMMSEYSDSQMMTSKYSKLLLKTLNHYFKSNQINKEKVSYYF